MIVWLYVAAALVCAAFTGWLASTKGREPFTWFFLGLLFGPIALFALGFSPEIDYPRRERGRKEADFRSP